MFTFVAGLLTGLLICTVLFLLLKRRNDLFRARLEGKALGWEANASFLSRQLDEAETRVAAMEKRPRIEPALFFAQIARHPWRSRETFRLLVEELGCDAEILKEGLRRQQAILRIALVEATREQRLQFMRWLNGLHVSGLLDWPAWPSEELRAAAAEFEFSGESVEAYLYPEHPLRKPEAQHPPPPKATRSNEDLFAERGAPADG